MRAILFTIFFSVGALGLALAMLADEFVAAYKSRASLERNVESLAQLELLIDDFQALTEQLQADPNMVQRVAAVTLGTDPNDPNTAYPHAQAAELEAARQAIEDTEEPQTDDVLPEWLERITEPSRRWALLLAGGFLVLLSFMLFARKGEPGRRDDGDE